MLSVTISPARSAMSRRIFLFGLLLICCRQVGARMYQWINPETGTTQFSGKPPTWYRSGDGGPRIFVFENSRLIDDTARVLVPAERDRLQRQAFMPAEADKQADKEKYLEARLERGGRGG